MGWEGRAARPETAPGLAAPPRESGGGTFEAIMDDGTLYFVGTEIKVGDPITENMLWWLKCMAREQDMPKPRCYREAMAKHDLGLCGCEHGRPDED